LITYFLGNICVKNCRNRAVYVKNIASQRWDVFLRHGVQIPYLILNAAYIAHDARTDTHIHAGYNFNYRNQSQVSM